MDWKISKRSKACSKCQKVFEANSVFVSALFEQGDGFLRKDYCESCWEGCNEKDCFGSWRSRIPEEGKKPPALADPRVLFNLFVRLQSAQDPHQQNLAYFLALMLLRKRVLRIEDTRTENGQEYIIVENPEEEVEFKLLVRDLPEHEIELLKEDLSQVLETTL